MGLSGSLFAGISGLQRNQTRLDVIGNNIANVNTYGFKSQRLLFQDQLYRTLRSGTAPSGNYGGTNPSQVGAGVDMGQISTNFNQGDFETTGIESDLAIDGNGFFVLAADGEQMYTRDGAFTLNQERKLVNPTNGMYVQGWNQTRDNAGNSIVNAGGALENVIIPIGDNRIAKATTEIIFNGNLNNAGDIATTGSILNSQKLFTSKVGDVEITSGSVDISDIFIKDPAGGVDNVRLFKGTGTKNSDSDVLQAGDQVIVQMMKGSRPLEATFVYGDPDLVNNTSGDLGPDGFADSGLESYDGTTLDDFTSWFNYAFGLFSAEDTGASSDANAAHGVDGDNPNDLVDMGAGGANPFTDETDGSGFDLVLTERGAGLTTGGVRKLPTAAFLGGAADRQFTIYAGSASDVGIESSWVDMDGTGTYNADKDIALEGVNGYVVTGNSTVTKGNVGVNQTLNLTVRAMFNMNGNPNADLNDLTAVPAGNVLADAYIDTGNNARFDKGTDMVIDNAVDTNFLNINVDAIVSAGTDPLQVRLVGTDLGISKGMFIENSNTRYFVESVTDDGTNTFVTFDVANEAGAGAVAAVTNLTFQGASLVGKLKYNPASTGTSGDTLVTDLNIPTARVHPVTGKYMGVSFFSNVVDNEKGVAGAQVIPGDMVVRVQTPPVTLTTAGAVAGATDVTFTSVAGLRTGQTFYDGTNVYTVEVIDSTTNTVTFDQNVTVAAGQQVIFSGFAYVDADNSGTINESVFRVRNTGGATPRFFIDVNHDGNLVETGDTPDLIFDSAPTLTNLSGYEDNAVVYTDPATGNVYRKVPLQYDPSEMTVYLDKNNKGSYDEQRYNVLYAGDTVTNDHRWVLDENGNGIPGDNEWLVISEKAPTALTDFENDTLTLNRPSSTTVNRSSSGAGRIQIRGNIGVDNALSKISFISGSNHVERMVFENSALTNGTQNAASTVTTAVGESTSQNIVVYDSLGRSHDVNMTFVLESKDNDKATWRWYAECADATQSNGYFPVGDPRGSNPGINVGSGTVEFDNFGRYLRDTDPPMISIPLEGMDTDSALVISPDFSILTSFAENNGSEVDVREQDGYAQGVMDSFSVDNTGKVIGIYTNGLRETVAQIAMAAFANPSGLIRSGSNMYQVSSNSGNAMIGEALTGERGSIRSRQLEQSNVDITTEFTNMISTQRAYQASSRVITKSDELLQELMQVIR